MRRPVFLRFLSILFFFSSLLPSAYAFQSNSGTVSGTITDPSGALVPGASVEIANHVSGYTRKATTDATGQFRFYNVPFNPYRISVSAEGFGAASKSVDINSIVPITLPIQLSLAASSTTVTVESGSDLIENDSTFHTDVDRSTIDRMPLESQSSSLSSIVTLSSPGVTADSNGLFHGLGDHAENSFSVDGQPITDQQSKVFSNQLPSDAVQSLEVIGGAPPAEYGDKTSLIIKATTRSGQGVTSPHGSIALDYGTFGTASLDGNIAYGGQNWGNFLAVSGMNSGRFLDGPEFQTLHNKGNQQNIFDRVDFQFADEDSLHTNLQYTRSWFQTPNSYDTMNVFDQFGNSVGAADQRSKIETFNIAPTWTHIINQNTVLNFGAYIRRDGYNYIPSNNPLADLGPIQQETVQQYRTLTNTGVRSDISWVKGIHNVKIGALYQQTFLRENLHTGIVDPALNAPCVDAEGSPVNGFTDPSQCAAADLTANDAFNPVLLPHDLTRGGINYFWNGRTDVKQLALYAQDQITKGPWLLNLGIRGDLYNGLSVQRQAEPRVGISYNIKQTNTVLRASYARVMETPFNENLVLSVKGCYDPVIQGIFETLGQCVPASFDPGFRNEFHAGIQQAFGRHLVVSGEYIWKYTHNAYDFSVFGSTPITFPIAWHNSKIPGFALRANVPETHGISAFLVLSSVSARFFNPQVGGIGTTPGTPGSNYPFRIDHDERYNQTAHLQYTLPFRKSTWLGFNWRYDSGLVAGSTPCYNVTDPNSGCSNFSFDPNGNPLTIGGQPAVSLSSLTADQQFQAGLACNGVRATPGNPLPDLCLASQLSSGLLKIPAPNTGNDDRNPPRIQPRNLFDIALGEDNLFHGDKRKIGLRVTAVNVTNKYALYNFLSTFSGTHYVTPRAITAEISYSF
ncbi:TonB-dependent receptor [Edaphobacter albus]|uniref:TonB-dependent receptor n=1 Tax=Edaphobacter sp. 4G125 TaxID=2763071 RepID=UPI0016483939|nr:TonB-dependent receptor [Edaphobacter sp. 4G125]QNI36377.1 TonB-dependent receptor [Edaphobacter sp. 4G125]